MKRNNNILKARIGRCSLIIPIALLAVTLSGNAQTTLPSSDPVLPATKDSVPPGTKAEHPEFTSVIHGADSTSTKPADKKIYFNAHQMPQFPGGEKALMKFFRQHLNYPYKAYEYGIEGKVIVRFVVNEFGKVEKVEVVKKVDPSLDDEAIRIIKSMPDFIPGQLENGRKVQVWCTIPIIFNPHNGIKPPPDTHREMPVFVMDGKVLPKGYNTSAINKDSVTVKVFKPDTDAHKAYLISKFGKQAAYGVVQITTKK